MILKKRKWHLWQAPTSLFVRACSPANSSMLRPPIFVGSGSNDTHTKMIQQFNMLLQNCTIHTCHGKVQLRQAVGFRHFFGSGVLGWVAGKGPNLFAWIANRLIGRAFDRFAGGRTPLVAWICLHKSILVLQEKTIWGEKPHLSEILLFFNNV